MATLSEDDSGWKAGGVKRRDFRHSHDGPEVSGSKKKNTKKWCKGVVGREHVIVTVPWKKYSTIKDLSGYLIDKCERCGKEMSLRWDPARRKPRWMR